MNRRDFVAALVAAGAVCAGLNTGCSKSSKDQGSAPSGRTETEESANRPPSPPESAESSQLTSEPAPSGDGETSAASSTTEDGDTSTVTKPGRRHEPVSDNPAGDGSTL